MQKPWSGFALLTEDPLPWSIPRVRVFAVANLDQKIKIQIHLKYTQLTLNGKSSMADGDIIINDIIISSMPIGYF